MPSHRASAATAGALYLVTFATSFPALALKLPFLEGGGSAVAAQSAAVLEILLALACIGTAVAMHPIGRRFSPTLAPGFVASRLLEASVIVTGVLALLSLTTTRAAPDPSPAVDTALVAVHDWSALTGYEPEARNLLVDWCLAHRDAFERSGVVRPRVGPLLDMAITVASTTLRVARMPFEIFDSLGDAMRRFGIRARSTPSVPPLSRG